MIKDFQEEIKAEASKEKAKILAGFFKTGKGEYGYGDKFLGITVPETRALVKKYQDMPLEEILQLLASSFHEERLGALLIMVNQFARGTKKQQKNIYTSYLKNTKHINSWDLVDLSADRIVGAYLEKRPKKIMLDLAESKLLWERRIAILATFHFIKNGEGEWTLKIAEKLLHDKQDLMHKAVGWMLREVGKRCSQDEEEVFLQKHAAQMPRTMLRYAIERFEEKKRQRYLRFGKK